MSDLTIEEFCDLHEACKDGREWAIKHCTSMQDAWSRLNSERLIWVATRNGVLTDKELRLFAVWSARQVQHFMKDPRSLAALDVAEKHANGQASVKDLAAAGASALDAARASAWAAAWASAWAAAAAWAAARAAARASAWAAARASAWAAARASAGAAARAAAGAAARAAARAAALDAQAQWLRENTKPNFTKTTQN